MSVSESVTLMCDGTARGWLAGDTDGLAGWQVTVGRVSVTVSVSVMSVGDGLADARKADLN